MRSPAWLKAKQRLELMVEVLHTGLAASGITAGCSTAPPLYCPDDPLTRGQMAVFLSKALGLHFAP
jgi:hypothetical protein